MPRMGTREIPEKFAMDWSPRTIHLHRFLTSTKQAVSKVLLLILILNFLVKARSLFTYKLVL